MLHYNRNPLCITKSFFMTNKEISQNVEVLHIEKEYYFIRIGERAFLFNSNKMFIVVSEKEEQQKQLFSRIREFEKAKKTATKIAVNAHWKQTIKTLESMIQNIDYRFQKEREGGVNKKAA